MSDTDDTDVLLLIPPDFFLHLDSDDNNDKFCDNQCLVDHLITQVHRLENRVNKIELNSDSQYSSCSTLVPRSEMSEPFMKKNHYPDVFMSSSSKSTPQKPKSRYYGNSLPSSPQTPKPGSPKYRRAPRFNPKLTPRIMKTTQTYSHNQSDDSVLSSSPEKGDPKQVLMEIDQFLNNVKVIQQLSNQKVNLDKPVLTLSDLHTNEEANRRFSQVSLQGIDHISEGIESEKFFNLKDNKIEALFENKNFTQSQQSWKCGDNKESFPDMGYDVIYEEKSTVVTSTEESDPTVIEQRTEPNLSKSKSTPMFKNANSKSGNKYNSAAQTSNASNANENSEASSNYSSVAMKSLPSQCTNVAVPSYTNTASLNLFSLAEIWKNSANDIQITESELTKIVPKLQEEKYRRKHCEKLIQDLQMKILEMQQRLAVAVQVDTAKDEAILRFHDAWEKVANRWKSLETERNSLSQKLLSIQEKSSTEIAEAAQKVVQYELEVSKALDLARDSQEKCVNLEKEREEFTRKLDQLQLEVTSSTETVQQCTREKTSLIQKITALEKDSLQDKKNLMDTQSELAKQKVLYQACNNELSSLRNEYNKLEKKIQEKQTTIFSLETEKNCLMAKIENIHKHEMVLEEQVKTLEEESEKTKTELRNFYQQQVEVLVKDKLKEFQEQLEQAEKSLQKELHSREQTIARTAAKQIQKLAEKHKLEISLLEQKHQEEIRLCNIQSSQFKQQVETLQTKLETYHAKRSNLAQELHTVMEQQWLEALRIINNQKSPLGESPRQFHESQRDSTDARIAELRTMLFVNEQKEKEDEFVQTEKYKNKTKHTVTDMSLRNQSEDIFQTPTHSRTKLDETPYNEIELQKYIRMLLDKLPIKPPIDKATKEGKVQHLSSQESSTTEFADVSSSWPQLQTQVQKDRSIRDQRNKPPWK